jgi:hypothetical protein
MIGFTLLLLSGLICQTSMMPMPTDEWKFNSLLYENFTIPASLKGKFDLNEMKNCSKCKHQCLKMKTNKINIHLIVNLKK